MADDVGRRAVEKLEATRGKIHDLHRISAASERVVSTCDAQGPPEDCALMHALEPDDNPLNEGGKT